MAHLECVACGKTLTRECSWGSAEDYDATSMDRAPAVPVGLMVRLEGADEVPVYQGEAVIRVHVYSPAEAIALNPEDLLPDSLVQAGDDNGCCGSDGLDGPNRACRCGVILATEWSDCWTQSEVRFLPSAVIDR